MANDITVTNRSKLTSTDRMSNRAYHAAGKPTWWARTGEGGAAKFLEIGRCRGDKSVDIIVDVTPGTEVHIGCGKGAGSVRQTVTTEQVALDQAASEVQS